MEGMDRELKMAILKDLIKQMHKSMAGKPAEKGNMQIAKLDDAKEGPGAIEAAMSSEEGEEAKEPEEGGELMEDLKRFLKGDTALPEAKGVTVEVFGMKEGKGAPKSSGKESASVPVEGTKMMLKELLKSKKLGKFA